MLITNAKRLSRSLAPTSLTPWDERFLDYELTMSSLRSKVLSCYRSLHRTRLKVFEGDQLALEAGKHRIRSEFAKHKNETDPTKILELVAVAESAEKFLRCNVLQGIQTDRGTFRLKITKDTELQKNAPRPSIKS